MLPFPELPFDGDTIDLSEEEDVPETDFLSGEEAEADETVDVDEQE